MRKTKIVATLGPASSTPAIIRSLVAEGVDAFRLNCSHLSTDALGKMIVDVRESAPDTAILVDIQGPKMRYGGDEMVMEIGGAAEFSFDVLGLGSLMATGGLSQLNIGHRLLLDDGRIETRVTNVGSVSITVEVIRGGTLRRNKGVNLPDTPISGGVLSDKDRADIDLASSLGAEIVAVSFVQSPADIEEVRSRLGPATMVVAKIERPHALELLEEICAVSDGVMAARGDLGVELPYEMIPAVQRRIGQTAMRRGIVSICATEMLESMISSSRPTRAEVADVSAAVLDGFDAVMLSGETAIGHDPVGAVMAMARICSAAELEFSMPNVFADANPQAAAVTAAASALAKRVGADSILALTYTGYSARLLAACRPNCSIVAVTPESSVARSLKLCRGVSPIVAERPSDVSQSIVWALRAGRQSSLIHVGDTVVICASRMNPRSDADTLLLHVED